MNQHRGVAATVFAAVALQPFNPYTIVGPISVADLALVTALATVFGHQALTDDGFFATGARPLLLFLAMLMVWLTIAASGWHVTQFAAFGLVILLVALYAQSTSHIDTLLWGLVAGGFIAAVLTLYSIFIDPSFGGRTAGYRSTGPFPPLIRTIGIPTGSFGAFSTYLLAGWPFAIIKYCQTRRRWLLIPISTIFAAAVLIQSRATWLAILAAVLVLFIGIYGRQAWDIGWRNAGASAFVIGFMSAVCLAGAWAMIQINAENAFRRFNQFSRSLELILQYPVTGVTPPVLPYFEHAVPHNMILLLSVVGGLPGTLALIAALTTSVAGFYKSWFNSLVEPPTILSIAAGLSANLTNLSLAPGFTRAFWLLVGSSAVLICATDGSIDMQEKYHQMISNSQLLSTLRTTMQGSQIVIVLSADKTDTRDQFADAWKNSSHHRLIQKMRHAWENSNLSSILIGG